VIFLAAADAPLTLDHAAIGDTAKNRLDIR
jgi:hypothetical protein